MRFPKKVSSLSSELLKIKEQYIQAISKERLNSLGHVAILEQKLQQHRTVIPQRPAVEGDSAKEELYLKRFELQEARIQDLKTALIESSAVHNKLESSNVNLNRKLKETQDAFKNLVVYCHDLELAGISDSVILENEALKLKVNEYYYSDHWTNILSGSSVVIRGFAFDQNV